MLGTGGFGVLILGILEFELNELRCFGFWVHALMSVFGIWEIGILRFGRLGGGVEWSGVLLLLSAA